MKHRHLHKRFLVPNARRGTGLGYDSRPQRILNGTLYHVDSEETIRRIAEATAMCDEPECDSEALASYAESAFTAHTLRHMREVQTAQEERKLLTAEQRLVNVVDRARRQRVDVEREVFILRKQVDRAAKGRSAVSVMTMIRLEKVEALLDGATDLPRQSAA